MGVAGWAKKSVAAGLAAAWGFCCAVAAFDPGLYRTLGFRGRPAGRSPSRAVEVGVDIHLVMNTFNRMAGSIPLEEGAAGGQIFNLCDYLRNALMHTVPAEIALASEVELLESYLRLAAAFRGWQLEAPVTFPPEARAYRVQAHSLCMIAQTLMGAFSPDTPGRWALPVRIGQTLGSGIDIHLSLGALTPQAPARRHRVDEDMQALCRAMSRHAVQWSYSLVRRTGHGIAVRVQIRPAPSTTNAVPATADGASIAAS